MAYDPEKYEWTGVIELYDKVRNGLYRANATTIVMFFYLIAMVFITEYMGTYIIGGLSLFEGIALIVSILVLIWIVTFFLGYAGLGLSGWAAPTPVSNITPNTNASLRAGDFKPLSNSLTEQTFANDMRVGRLSVQKDGIDGIIKLAWRDVISISPQNAQNIQITARNRVFLVPFGKKKIVLHFDTPEDLTAFMALSSQFVERRS